MKKTPFNSPAPWAIALFLLLGAPGCRSRLLPSDEAGHERAAGHEHDHGESAIGITRWTELLELFAEHQPAIAGQELTFLAHLTVLGGFRALENAQVTLVLEGPTRVEATVSEMLRPGIFRPTLTAPSAGTYRGSLRVKGPAWEDTIEGFAIVVHPNGEAARQASVAEKEGQAISFLKEQQWQLPFATAFATRGHLVPSMEVAGEVTTPPGGQAELGSAIAGRVVAPPAGLPRPGQAVRRGELLASVAAAPAAPEDAARADLAVVEAEARLQAARTALQRAERLFADRAVAQRELEDARREFHVGEEAVHAARRARDVFSGAASGSGGGTYHVCAPMDGMVVAVEASEGKSVLGGDLLFRVVNLQELWVHARVPEQQAALIRADQDAAFKLPGLDRWFPLDVTGADASASVVTVGRTVDLHSRTVDVLYALRAPDERLRLGAMLRVALPAGEPWQGVVIPRDALLEEDGRSVVYVQVEGEAFEERVVRLGPKAGAQVGIVSGVNDGERVVTLGARVIRLSSRAATAPAHGHVH